MSTIAIRRSDEANTTRKDNIMTCFGTCGPATFSETMTLQLHELAFEQGNLAYRFLPEGILETAHEMMIEDDYEDTELETRVAAKPANKQSNISPFWRHPLVNRAMIAAGNIKHRLMGLTKPHPYKVAVHATQMSARHMIAGDKDQAKTWLDRAILSAELGRTHYDHTSSTTLMLQLYAYRRPQPRSMDLYGEYHVDYNAKDGFIMRQPESNYDVIEHMDVRINKIKYFINLADQYVDLAFSAHDPQYLNEARRRYEWALQACQESLQKFRLYFEDAESYIKHAHPDSNIPGRINAIYDLYQHQLRPLEAVIERRLGMFAKQAQGARHRA